MAELIGIETANDLHPGTLEASVSQMTARQQITERLAWDMASGLESGRRGSDTQVACAAPIQLTHTQRYDAESHNRHFRGR